MIRIRRGVSLLNKVVKQFNQAVADLDVAVQQIESQQNKQLEKTRAMVEKNQAAEEALRAKNIAAETAGYEKEEELFNALQRARTVRLNFAALVGAE